MFFFLGLFVLSYQLCTSLIKDLWGQWHLLVGRQVLLSILIPWTILFPSYRVFKIRVNTESLTSSMGEIFDARGIWYLNEQPIRGYTANLNHIFFYILSKGILCTLQNYFSNICLALENADWKSCESNACTFGFPFVHFIIAQWLWRR